jgi:hypothetical protein
MVLTPHSTDDYGSAYRVPRMTILSPAGMTPRELSDEVIGV